MCPAKLSINTAMPYPHPFGRRINNINKPKTESPMLATCQKVSYIVWLYGSREGSAEEEARLSPSPAATSKLNNHVAASPGRLGSGNAHNQIIQTREKSVTARSSRGRKRGRLI